MLKGLPASGKSTYAKELVEKGWIRVNKDDLRAMMYNSNHGKGKENFVIGIRNAIIADACAAKLNIVVDDTNFNPVHEKTLRSLANGYGYEFEVKFFDVDIETCISRDKQRTKSVGEEVIRDMYNLFLAKKVVNEVSDKYVPDTTKPTAYIFDIDGTLALNNHGRSPYDYSKVHLDSVNEDVYKVYMSLLQAGNKMFIVSGRDDDCFGITTKWFWANGIPHDGIFMRKTGDKRKDSIVKREIFDENFREQYNILGVFDDRQQVVDMWRSLGLTCFQVAPGSF